VSENYKASNNILYLESLKVWTTKIYIYDKKWWFNRYIINITSSILEIDFSLIKNSYKYVNSYNYLFADKSIAYIRKTWELYWLKEGSTKVTVSDKWYIKYIYNLNVLLVPICLWMNWTYIYNYNKS